MPHPSVSRVLEHLSWNLRRVRGITLSSPTQYRPLNNGHVGSEQGAPYRIFGTASTYSQSPTEWEGIANGFLSIVLSVTVQSLSGTGIEGSRVTTVSEERSQLVEALDLEFLNCSSGSLRDCFESC